MDTGHGAAWTLGTSTFAASTNPRVEITPPSEEVPVVRTPHLGLADGAVVPGILGDLKNVGNMTVRAYMDPNVDVPLRVSETHTLTYPIPTGSTNGATWAFTGTIERANYGALQTNGLMEVTCEVAVLGTITKTDAS